MEETSGLWAAGGAARAQGRRVFQEETVAATEPVLGNLDVKTGGQNQFQLIIFICAAWRAQC